MNCLAWVLWNSSALNHGAVSPALFPHFYGSSLNTSLNGLIQYMAFCDWSLSLNHAFRIYSCFNRILIKYLII